MQHVPRPVQLKEPGSEGIGVRRDGISPGKEEDRPLRPGRQLPGLVHAEAVLPPLLLKSAEGLQHRRILPRRTAGIQQRKGVPLPLGGVIDPPVLDTGQPGQRLRREREILGGIVRGDSFLRFPGGPRAAGAQRQRKQSGQEQSKHSAKHGCIILSSWDLAIESGLPIGLGHSTGRLVGAIDGVAHR